MGEVGIRALKQNASAVVASAVSGENVTITDRGRPVAQLTALPATRMQQLLASGQARPPRRSVAELPFPEPGGDLSAELAAARATERY